MTLELLPFGKEQYKKTIKVIDIANQMTHQDPWKFGNYKIRVRNNTYKDCPWQAPYILNYPREQYDAMYLLYLVLRKYVHETVGDPPLDCWAERDKDAASGPGHSLLPGVSSGVGQWAKRDSSKSGNIAWHRRHLAKLKREAVSIWEQQLQKEDLSRVQTEQEEA